MIDYEIDTDIRACSECKHYLGGSVCRAFDEKPLALFLNAAKHNKTLPNQKGAFIFETDKPTVKTCVYTVLE
ncbi:MAG: hypothetical protein RSC80_09970 [Odoribacter sp.]